MLEGKTAITLMKERVVKEESTLLDIKV